MHDRIELHCGDDLAVISFQGGQLLHWRAGGRERLFMSPRARFEQGQAIRGGVPVIFPQFAERGPGPRHGFARLQRWRLLERAAAHAVLALEEDAATLAAWPYRFEARLSCTLAPGALQLELAIRNRDQRAFEFGAALHAYFALSVEHCSVVGLERAGFEEAGIRRENADAPLRPAPPLDRIYVGGDDRLRLADGDRGLWLERSGFADWVVWNPGRAGADALDDLGASAAADFLCVEPAQASSSLRLEPGQGWCGRLRMQIDHSA